MKMSCAYTLLAICVLVVSAVTAQSQPDNIISLIDAFVGLAVDKYKSTNGIIPAPDIRGVLDSIASNGTISGLSDFKRDDAGGVAEPEFYNPRLVNYKFRLTHAVAHYKNYVPPAAKLGHLPREVTFEINDLDFGLAVEIEVKPGSCTFNLKTVDVIGKPKTNSKVTGSFRPIFNIFLSGFVSDSVNVIVEFLKKDLVEKIGTKVPFDCSIYNASKYFHLSTSTVHPIPTTPTAPTAPTTPTTPNSARV